MCPKPRFIQFDSILGLDFKPEFLIYIVFRTLEIDFPVLNIKKHKSHKNYELHDKILLTMYFKTDIFNSYLLAPLIYYYSGAQKFGIFVILSIVLVLHHYY